MGTVSLIFLIIMLKNYKSNGFEKKCAAIKWSQHVKSKQFGEVYGEWNKWLMTNWQVTNKWFKVKWNGVLYVCAFDWYFVFFTWSRKEASLLYIRYSSGLDRLGKFYIANKSVLDQKIIYLESAFDAWSNGI